MVSYEKELVDPGELQVRLEDLLSDAIRGGSLSPGKGATLSVVTKHNSFLFNHAEYARSYS